jgi:hypothetical protein
MTDAPNATADGLADFWRVAARTNQSLADCRAIIAEIAAQTTALEAKMKVFTDYVERKRAEYARRMSAPSGPAPATVPGPDPC